MEWRPYLEEVAPRIPLVYLEEVAPCMLAWTQYSVAGKPYMVVVARGRPGGG